MLLFLALLVSTVYGSSSLHSIHKRSILNPIDTSSADGIAGGTVECSAAPVASFFEGLKPPVHIYTYVFLIIVS